MFIQFNTPQFGNSDGLVKSTAREQNLRRSAGRMQRPQLVCHEMTTYSKRGKATSPPGYGTAAQSVCVSVRLVEPQGASWGGETDETELQSRDRMDVSLHEEPESLLVLYWTSWGHCVSGKSPRG